MKHRRFLFGTLIAIALVASLVLLFGFAVQKGEACHAEGGADCEGRWWVNLVGPGEGWILDNVVGDTSGTWLPGETHVDYDVTATWKHWVVSGYWDYVNRPTTLPVYDCELTVSIHGVNRDVSEFYNKPTGDDNHCHRINWGDLTATQQNAFKAMHGNDPNYGWPNHGNWQSAYNNHIDQNPIAHLVTPGGYDACPIDYQVDPGNQARCRKWVDTSHWVYQIHRFTGTIQLPDCYEPCDETVDGIPSGWSDWVLVDGVYTSTRTVPLLDSRNNELVCGSRTETQTQDLCAETIAVDLPDSYSDWSPWVYDPEDGLEHSFQTVFHHSYLGDAIDPDHVCTPPADPEIVEQTRGVEYPSGALIPIQTCEPAPGNWVYEVIVPEGASAELISGALSGPWLDLYAPEDNAASVPTFVFTWPSGYSEGVVGEVIDKNLECLQCLVTELYGMTLYTDPNAPAVYWEGPLDDPFGFPACPVIPLNGEVPAAFRVTQICSICPESGYEGGYIFHGVPVAEGRVLRYDCYGHGPRYFYLGHAWDEEVRFDFDADGTRRSCRVDGCVDWINETAGIVVPSE